MPTKIHFLNVGHGACTVIEHASGRLTVIDINNGGELDDQSANELSASLRLGVDAIKQAARSGTSVARALLRERGFDFTLTNPVEYISNVIKTNSYSSIFRFILTHPDMDHMRGLSALQKQGTRISCFWDTAHNKIPELQSGDEADWAAYQALRQGSGTRAVLRNYRGYRNTFYNEDPKGVSPGDGIYVLSPTRPINADANATQNWNNLSYVLKIVYQGVHVILGADAEEAVWASLVEECPDELKSCDVLQASHHGRESGYHQPALELMRPKMTIVSVGRSPTTDAMPRYRLYSERVWSTRWQGNIALTISETGEASAHSDRDPK